ncbi:Gfo/Idh/MocA family protein [Nocardioides jiangxiensis]|uniref:Gfo/Idh/MocA family oxidoreductase n=1 Tax=Nocardioides jiangxiensis TaxID=3064524 RepID=A0ABT9AY44_9ACTN|nr:Gfo/Idh/MocA family oxidoreductase [Nocardioides sp. WY-20]MDO7867399.1 Gfo/Idh/MocA family oxidoreductase [Nocardioides sp. WY-20]
MTIRIGVVGTGPWARTTHAAGCAAHPDVELTGIWGRDLGRASALADPHGVPAYDDFDAFLEAVDAVTFAITPDVQAELAIRAARAGKHLLLDKPVATTTELADAVVDAARDVSSVVFFTGRFVPDWEAWLAGFRPATTHSGSAAWLTLLAPDSPYAGSTWRKEQGALWDVGPHALSFLLPALGPVVAVTGARGRGDQVQLVLTHESGATSSMDLSLTMPVAARHQGVELWDATGRHTRPDTPRDVEAAYAQALTELVTCIREGRTTHRCDVRFGRDVVDVLARCEAALGGSGEDVGALGGQEQAADQ